MKINNWLIRQIREGEHIPLGYGIFYRDYAYYHRAYATIVPFNYLLWCCIELYWWLAVPMRGKPTWQEIGKILEENKILKANLEFERAFSARNVAQTSSPSQSLQLPSQSLPPQH